MSIAFALECLKSDLENALLHASAAKQDKDTLKVIKGLIEATKGAITRNQANSSR